MGIAFGLGAALSWGVADYVAAMASRRTGALRVVLGFHVLATILLGIAVAASGSGVSNVSRDDLAWFALVGVLGWSSYLAFYRALAIGPISIVSPIVSAYAAVTVLWAVVISGDHLAGSVIAALVVTIFGVTLASSDVAQLRPAARAGALGVLLALLTAVLIGSFVFGVAHFADEYGWLVPIFLARAFSTIFVAATAVRGREWRFPELPRRLLAMIGLVAVVDSLGYVAFNFGIRHAETPVVAAAAAPYAVVPIVLGVLVLRERPTPVQWTGVGLVLAGMVLLGALS